MTRSREAEDLLDHVHALCTEYAHLSRQKDPQFFIGFRDGDDLCMGSNIDDKDLTVFLMSVALTQASKSKSLERDAFQAWMKAGLRLYQGYGGGLYTLLCDMPSKEGIETFGNLSPDNLVVVLKQIIKQIESDSIEAVES